MLGESLYIMFVIKTFSFRCADALSLPLIFT